MPAETWVALGHWARVNKLGSLTALDAGESGSPRFAFTFPRGQWVLQADSQLAEWNGLEVRLGFNPRMIGGQLHLHTLDVQKNLLPLVVKALQQIG